MLARVFVSAEALGVSTSFLVQRSRQSHRSLDNELSKFQ